MGVFLLRDSEVSFANLLLTEFVLEWVPSVAS